MKKCIALSMVALTASNCTGLDPSKLIPAGVSQFQAAIGSITTTETKLVTAWQAENRALQYISRRDYSCGDPRSALHKKLAAENPSKLVTEQQVNKYWTQSFKYLDAYIKLLTAIATGAQSDVATIKSIVLVGTTAASAIPTMPAGASAAVTALGTIATDVRNVFAIGRIIAAAQDAQAPLATAVKYLKKYYPAFVGNEQVLFEAWDECANERLLFIRDQPLGRIKGYQDRYFIPANGIDLDTAYQAYLAQRETFMLTATAKSINATLDQVLAQNANLADPKLTWESFQTAVQSMNTLYTDAKAAADAVEKFGTPAKTKSSAGQQASSGSTVVAWGN